MAYVFNSMGTGDRCREISHDNRTVLVYSNRDIINTEQVVFVVFDNSKPLYDVTVQISRKEKTPEEKNRYQERMMSVYRSILYNALKIIE